MAVAFLAGLPRYRSPLISRGLRLFGGVRPYLSAIRRHSARLPTGAISGLSAAIRPVSKNRYGLEPPDFGKKNPGNALSFPELEDTLWNFRYLWTETPDWQGSRVHDCKTPQTNKDLRASSTFDQVVPSKGSTPPPCLDHRPVT